MKTNLQKIITDSCKEINLSYTDNALPFAVTRNIIKDLNNEFSKIKWVSEDDGWNKAIEAVKHELRQRYF